MENTQNDPGTQKAFCNVGNYYYHPRPWGSVMSELWELLSVRDALGT